MRAINKIVVHCSATRITQDIGVKELDRMHRARGFRKIGYHFVVRRFGAVEVGRKIEEVGAHVEGHNRDSIGICLIGGLDQALRPDNNFTSAQFEGLSTLLDGLRKQFPRAGILGHRDLSPDQNGDGRISAWEWVKDCPCFDVREWLQTRKEL